MIIKVQKKKAYIKRMERELVPTQQHMPDFLIVFGGTNDFWVGCPIDRIQYEEWTKADYGADL